MASFKDELDENVQKTHEFLMEDLELDSFVEIEIVLKKYDQWLQQHKKEKMKEEANSPPEIEEGDYFG